MNNYELDPEELELTRPLSTERQAEIDELYISMAADLTEINGY